MVQKLSLTAWGGLCVLGGIASRFIMNAVKPPTNRSELLGQSVAQMLFLLVGVVLIGIGLARSRRG